MKSMFTVKNLQRALLAAGMIAATTGAFATAVTTSFQVTANVAKQCSVTAADLAFGTVNPLGANVDQTTTITVKCTKNSTYTVGLDAGVTSGATIGQRKMVNVAGDFMLYNLYKDSGRTTVWDNVTPDWVPGTGAGLGTGIVHTVYGRVPTGQTNLAEGSYVEPTITVTVTY
jgi:spore coat protein U-like protein